MESHLVSESRGSIEAAKGEASTEAIIIGTRGSALAMWQTEAVIALLRRQHPAAQFVIQTIKTQGDKTQALAIPMSQLGDKAMFVAELEQALLAGNLHIAIEPMNDRLLVEQERLAQQAPGAGQRPQAIDAAVHSLKDLPGELPDGLTIAAVTERADARDVLVSRRGWTLDRLPKGARVATSSLRRRAQLLHRRPDLQIVEIRGNIDTRLRKALAADGPDAVVLAAAGLQRLGLSEHISEYLALEVMLPAAGQGALAVEVRASDAWLVQLVAAAEHMPTRRAVQAERALLAALGGGCQVPIGVYASVEPAGNETTPGQERLALRAVVASPDGARLLRREGRGSLDDPAALGRSVAEALLAAGAGEILAEGRTRQSANSKASQE